MTKNIQLNRIENFPISFFAIALGLAGFTLLFQKVEEVLELTFNVSTSLLYSTLLIFVAISLIYLFKLLTKTKSVKEEFNHPVKMSFFPLIAKVLIVLSIVFLERNMIVSKYLWVSGAILQLIFTFVIVSIWIRHPKFEIKHITPAWFIPVVGSILLPIAGVQHFNPLFSWFFYSIGLTFWLVLFILFMNRAIFHHPVEEKLLPSYFILFAPPAIGFISYMKLVGEFDAFAKILYFLSLFLFLLILFQYKMFLKIKFYLSWWAYSFPLAAMGTATILVYHITSLVFFKYLAIFILIFLTIMIILLTYKTIYGMLKKQLCVAE